MNWGKMLKTIAFATLAMVAWVTFKVYFVHDPDNFFEMDARPYYIAWDIDNCKTFKCVKTSEGWPVKSAFEADEGWIYILNTESGDIALLIPREDPRLKHLVSLELDKDGDYRITDNGPQPGEISKPVSGMMFGKQVQYMLVVLVLVIAGITWFKRRAANAQGSDAELPKERTARGASAKVEKVARGAPQAAPEPATNPNDPVGSLLNAAKPNEAVAMFEKRVAADPAFQLPQA